MQSSVLLDYLPFVRAIVVMEERRRVAFEEARRIEEAAEAAAREKAQAEALAAAQAKAAAAAAASAGSDGIAMNRPRRRARDKSDAFAVLMTSTRRGRLRDQRARQYVQRSHSYLPCASVASILRSCVCLSVQIHAPFA